MTRRISLSESFRLNRLDSSLNLGNSFGCLLETLFYLRSFFIINNLIDRLYLNLVNSSALRTVISEMIRKISDLFFITLNIYPYDTARIFNTSDQAMLFSIFCYKSSETNPLYESKYCYFISAHMQILLSSYILTHYSV